MRNTAIKKTLAVGIAVGLLGAGVAYTQFMRGGGDDYNTAGVDAQRTSWVRTDRFISKDDFAKGGFQLQWQLNVGTQPRQLLSVIGGTTSGGGLTKPLNVIVSSSNTLTTVDNDSGVPGWVRHFDVAAPPAGTLACPGGMTANASRPVSLAIAVPTVPSAPRSGPPALDPRLPQGYTSVVGDPGAGLPTSATVLAPRAPSPAAGARGAGGAAPAGGGAPGAPGGAAAGRGFNAFGRGAPTYKTPFGAGRFGSGGGFFAVTSDGVLHTVGDGSGKELQPPVQFLPPNAHPSNLTAVPENNDQYHSYAVYAATTESCGGVPNRVWAIDLAMDTPSVTHVDTGASVVGDPAFSPDGTLFVAVGKGTAGSGYSNAILALEPKTLTVKDWFTDPKANFTSTPTIFKIGDRELLAAATADGRVYVLDTASLGGSDHKSPVSVSAAVSSPKTDFAPKSLASWQDADGSTYIAEPFAGAGPSGAPSNGAVTNGGVVALKVSDTGSLTPAWVSGDITSPLAPLIVNGVMFTASKSPTAVLYALDASTGKQLWSSGKAITSPAAGAPLWVGAGQVYIAASDNTVYAFGFAEERYAVGQ